MNKLANVQVMEDLKIGDVVEVKIEEGHVVFNYLLTVTDVQKEDGEVIAFGEGVTNEDKELAEEFTHRIDSSNFFRIVTVNEKEIKEVLSANGWNVINTEHDNLPSANFEEELFGLFTGLKIEASKTVTIENDEYVTCIDIYDLRDGRVSIDFMCIDESDNKTNQFPLADLEKVLTSHYEEEVFLAKENRNNLLLEQKTLEQELMNEIHFLFSDKNITLYVYELDEYVMYHQDIIHKVSDVYGEELETCEGYRGMVYDCSYVLSDLEIEDLEAKFVYSNHQSLVPYENLKAEMNEMEYDFSVEIDVESDKPTITIFAYGNSRTLELDESTREKILEDGEEIVFELFGDVIESFYLEAQRTIRYLTVKVEMENEYKITVSCDGANVLVENLTLFESVGINLFNFEDTEEHSIKNAFYNKDWDKFIGELIEIGYLN